MDFNHHHDRINKDYDLNNKIMVTAVLCLTFVILLVILLHIYARCMLRRPRRNRNTTTSFIHHSQEAQQTVKSGLDQTTIDIIPSFPFKQIDSNDHIECAVCLCMLEDDDLARRLPNCNHVFHMTCIDTWLSGQSTCPICRADAAPRLVPHEREPPMGVDQLTQVVVVASGEVEHGHEVQSAVNSGKINNGSGTSSVSSSSFRMSSFRKMISGRDRSSSSNRIQVCEEIDAQRQV